MRKIHILTLLFVLLTACSPESRSLEEFSAFTERLSQKSSGYSDADWDDALQHFDYLWQDLQRYEYSPGDYRTIDSLRRRCVEIFSVHF
ncbi:MAG: hypothetical protein J6Z12_04955 [Paludibacteraceae bacterium]|nr:hypothetical protein [Paludibacteraceae bacterium]